MTDGRTDALTVGYLLGTYSVRKSSQESVSTQQIPVKFLQNKPHFEYKIQKFEVPNKGPFLSYGRTER